MKLFVVHPVVVLQAEAIRSAVRLLLHEVAYVIQPYGRLAVYGCDTGLEVVRAGLVVVLPADCLFCGWSRVFWQVGRHQLTLRLGCLLAVASLLAAI